MPTELTIVHDYLTQRGGAERVVLVFAEAFPDAPILTSLYDPDDTFEAFGDLEVRTGILDRSEPGATDPEEVKARQDIDRERARTKLFHDELAAKFGQ